MKKYNRAVHILFWVLIVFLVSIAALSMFSKNDKISSMLAFFKGAESTEKEKIVIREVREVEKEVDWYYFIASGYSANDSSQGTDGTTATGKRIDIFFNSKKEAKEFGRKGIWVKIVNDSYKIELAGLHESIWLLDN